MKMTDAVLSTSSVTKTTRVAPSALIKSAHLIERIGLAKIGGSSSLYVAAGLMRRARPFCSESHLDTNRSMEPGRRSG
jgi:hypothetical protein